MTRRLLLLEIKNDNAFRKTWKDLIQDGIIDRIINYCECYRSPYQADLPDHPTPHIQSEKNGGIKAWDKLSYLLRTMPFDVEEIESEEKYDGETFMRDEELPSPRARFKRK